MRVQQPTDDSHPRIESSTVECAATRTYSLARAAA